MRYRRFHDPKEFYEVAFPILLKHEAQNAIPLGNVVLGKQGGEKEGWRNPESWYMATVADQAGKVALVALMTPPFNLTLYETDNVPQGEALRCLCDNLIAEGVGLPGVISENGLAGRFAELYTKRMGMGYATHKNLRIYTLERVDPRVPWVGALRRAEKRDLYFLPYWRHGFTVECGLESETLQDAAKQVERAMARQALYVLEDGGMPVSMAMALREMKNGRCVGMVYTPPYLREKGYASSCVAQVSQAVLDMGYAYVSLFTDLSNPISNSIYQKIGYRPLCDYRELRFDQGG